ncbi:uncharacterized protein B0P05DRAFT_546125 [Gilbertella persicaria]|uniref:uncharacterized protein n=1 Tax=Gilbertella persicaria TaxID=101096 RepID=UPI002220B69D|nr:uncharacterized protein B0P05DRAFT_546125 [Gilbertella persicaria]KAI8076502.1 hypothetical protein B0P05DRAFT_546125 [Gilbertella persicaria]
MIDSLKDEYNKLIPSQSEESNLLLVEDPAVYGPPELIMNNSSSTTVPELLAENSRSGSTSEEAVFPPTYAALPTTKLEEEPNPFEQSFEGATKPVSITKLPSVHTIEIPKPARVDALMESRWDTLRSGVLSPSMLAGPTLTLDDNSPHFITTKPIKYEEDTSLPPLNQPKKSNKRTKNNSDTNLNNKRSKKTNSVEDEEKRKNFLERNRIAALKCRQRKKQWLQNLQAKVEYLTADNEQLHMQANALREELIQLKTLLMAHKDCPINQQAIQIALNRPIPGALVPLPPSSQS